MAKRSERKSAAKVVARGAGAARVGPAIAVSASRKATLLGFARALDSAAVDARGTRPFAESVDLSLAQAYEVQRLALALRLKRGEKRVGLKIDISSRATMVQTGVSDPIWGRLTDGMLVEEGAQVHLDRFVHPRVVPEIAFLMKKPLAGVVTPLQALSAVEAVAVAMGIIDSRYERSKLSLTDLVADNCSCAGVAVGAWHAPDFDFSNLGLIMSFNGHARQIGSTARILGHPLRSLLAAARVAARAGEALNSGDIVMAGGITAAEALVPGTWVETEMQVLGRVAFGVAA